MSSNTDEIITAYSSAAAQPGGTDLADWVRRYPDHEGALIEYALFDLVFESGVPYAAEAEGEIEARFARAAQRAREEMLHSEAAAAPAPLGSLLGAARARGLTPQAVGAAIGVGASLVLKLDQRLVQPASLPRHLVTRLSEVLGRGVAEVAAYLRQPARLAANASYKARQAPRTTGQQTFAAAVDSSLDMTPEQKAHWLAASDPLGEAE